MTSRLWGGVKDIFVGSIMDLLLKSVTIRRRGQKLLDVSYERPLNRMDDNGFAGHLVLQFCLRTKLHSESLIIDLLFRLLGEKRMKYASHLLHGYAFFVRLFYVEIEIAE